MVPWIFIHNPFERCMADHQRIFDAWEDGGVGGIVVGRLRFTAPDGTTIPTFAADPEVYEAFEITPPPESPRDLDKEKQFCEMLDDAASRGWDIMIFDTRPDSGERPPEEDPYGAVKIAAGTQAIMKAYPQAQGIILDGPGEHHYELAFHHGGELFGMREHWRQRYPHLGVDVERIERAIAHLRGRFHQLTPSLVRYHASGGMLSGLTLFDVNEDVLYWLRVRRETALASVAAVREQTDRVSPKVKLGGIPRSAAFSSLTGQDYEQMARYLDYVFPKHYFWHRGFDGLYGTVARWVERILEWNPTLTEGDGFAVVKALFGLELPGIQSLMDMEMGFPEEFFSQVVYNETRRALDAVEDPDRVIAWVGTGRSPHAGDPMPARDLHGILTGSEQAGLQRFLFHSTMHLRIPEWRVISGMCGNLWRETPEGYVPEAMETP